MADDRNPRLISSAEAADLLGISQTHVNRLADKGEIPVYARSGPNRARQFQLDDIEQIVRQQVDVRNERLARIVRDVAS